MSSSRRYTLSLSCPDRVGIVAAVSGFLASHQGGITESDAIAHGWVTRRGRSIVFCEAVVVDESGNPAVRGALTYKVSAPRPTD